MRWLVYIVEGSGLNILSVENLGGGGELCALLLRLSRSREPFVETLFLCSERIPIPPSPVNSNNIAFGKIIDPLTYPATYRSVVAECCLLSQMSIPLTSHRIL